MADRPHIRLVTPTDPARPFAEDANRLQYDPLVEAGRRHGARLFHAIVALAVTCALVVLVATVHGCIAVHPLN